MVLKIRRDIYLDTYPHASSKYRIHFNSYKRYTCVRWFHIISMFIGIILLVFRTVGVCIILLYTRPVMD